MTSLARLLLLVLPLLATVAHADAGFQLQSALVNVRAGAFQLDARVNYPMTDDVRSALAHGATVKLALQVVIEKKRRYWLDDKKIDATLQRELTWNALTQRYILKHLDRGEQESYPGLDQALIAAGAIDDWQIPGNYKLNADATYEVSVRAGYRSNSLPHALRVLAFWSDGWDHKTEWKTWTLPH